MKGCYAHSWRVRAKAAGGVRVAAAKQAATGGGKNFNKWAKVVQADLCALIKNSLRIEKPKKMQITGFVLEDMTTPWEMDGRKGETRRLVVIDRDEGEARLLQPLRLKIKESDLAGPPGSLRDTVVRLAITRIEQNERTKDVNIEGHVLEVAGSMRFEERQVKQYKLNRTTPQPAGTAAATA